MCCYSLYCFVLLIVYVLSPIDLLPEAVLGPVGLVDDLIAILAVLVYLAKGTRA